LTENKGETPREKRMRRLREFKDQREGQFKDFDIDDFVTSVEEIREVPVEELDIIVRYKRLTNEESLSISKISDENEQGLEILYMMLSKADANVTKDKILAMNPTETALIINAINEDSNIFLQ